MNLKKIALFALTLTVALFVAPFIALAGGNPVDSLSLSTPGGFISPEAVTALTAAITTIAAYFSGMLPGLKKIPDTTWRSIVTGLVVLAGAGALKFGFVTDDTIKFATEGLLPNFAYSTLIYKALQALVALLRNFGALPKTAELKSIPTEAQAVKKAKKTKA